MDSQGVLFILLVTLTALAGIGLLFILFARLNEINAIHRRSKFQHKREGTTDLLQCSALIRDGIILNKNGSLTASFFIQGIDQDQIIEAERNQISAHINHALNILDTGWMLHIDCIRVDSPKYIEPEKNAFPDIVSFAIDAERRAYFESRDNVYEGAQVLSATYLPPILAERKFVELLYDDNESNKRTVIEQTNSILDEFERQINFIESNLSAVLKMSRMRGMEVVEENGETAIYDEQLQYMQFCITGINQPIRLPKNTMFLDTIIGGQDLWTGTIPKIGDNYIMTVSIDGFPQESYPGILNVMTTIPCECRFSSRFQFVDRQDADNYASKISKKWKQKQRGIIAVLMKNPNAPIDQDAVDMTFDADEAVSEIRSGMVSYGFYTATIVLMDKDRDKLNRSAELVYKKIRNLGFNVRIETVNALEAYLGTIPGHGDHNIRRYFIHTLNLADMLPTNTIWTGEKVAPCPYYPLDSPVLMHTVASGRSPYRFNLHVHDVGHTAIIGPTGAGKSTLLAAIATSFRRYPDSKVIIFDKGRSLYALTKACGGMHFDLVSDTSSNLKLTPFSCIHDPLDRAWLLDWVDKTLLLNKVETTPEDRNEISLALSSLADTEKIDTPDLTKFLFELQSTRLREALQQYDVTGTMANLLSGTEDTLSLSDFTTFEMDALMDLGDKWCLPVLMYIFRRIEKCLLGQPTLIMIDEAWAVFKNEVFKEKLFEWLKVLRKKNCAVILATQGLTDIAESGMLANIRESTTSKIFLPNPGATNEDTIELYKQFSLNTRQIEIIASARKKREYYHLSDTKGGRLFDMALQPLSLAFLAVSDPETVQKIKEYEVSFGPDEWAEKWLNSFGLSLESYKEDFKRYSQQ